MRCVSEKLREQVDGLVEKYAELLFGETDEELKEKVKLWALYSHISKAMPPLVKHWNGSYPDAKEGMMELITEIKTLNEKHRRGQK